MCLSFQGTIHEDELRELLTTLGERFTKAQVYLIIDTVRAPL